MRLFLFITIVVFSWSTPVFAGGAAARSKQQGQMMRQQQQMVVQQELMKRKAQEEARRQAQQAIQQKQQAATGPAEITEVDITDLWEDLTQSSQSWTLILDQEAKEATVAYFIDFYRQNGINIQKPPILYVSMIDGMIQENPEMLEQPFPNIIQFMAIIEYDFDNGQNRDAMARQILGEQGYIENKKRLTQQYQ